MKGDDVLDDARLTTVGLLFESAAGLRRIFEMRLTKESDLSNQAFDVLIRLARTPEHRLRMSELAAQTSLTPSGLTRSVDRLEQSGLVARESCPDDRRGAFAVLTATGQAVMDRAIPDHIAHVDEVLQGLLTPDEEAMLSALLRKIRDQLYDPEGTCQGALEELGPLDCPSVD
jgi:MarR family transcriptional regulator, 2-MHQ and catechol-resistance regulon repressor